ncbi:hypothetical protein [Streptomyces sp. NBC_00385]|uniref:hypothetical protein n=1 Tax=Streptomyces sp. NBC_00385 TaxID=2975733 RepID=UPI002DDA340A|nr:hypothetical protein [Streptomyces sp. NBC_00385]WRZ05351.1 hypothetical protein OG959_19400 [Streptomyces sp. NBC_00385]
MGVIVLPGLGRPCPAGHPANGDWASSGRGDPGLGEGGAEEADEDAERVGEADRGGAGCAECAGRAGTAEGWRDAPGCEADGDADDGPEGAIDGATDGGTDD